MRRAAWLPEQQLDLGSPLKGLQRSSGANCSATNAAEAAQGSKYDHWQDQSDWALAHSHKRVQHTAAFHGSALLRSSLGLASVQGKGPLILSHIRMP